MAQGGVGFSGGEVRDFGGKITFFVLLTCIIAATGGLIFGYDIGISGGVTSMDTFLKKFFPSVSEAHKESTSKENEYCTFDSQLLTSFTSSLYLAALVSSFFGAAITRIFGRRISMFLGGLTFLIGTAFNGFAINLTMLIFGRLLLGVGIGFANQSVPLYLSEMAPARLRGALNIGFQLAVTVGIFAANLINFWTGKMKGGHGWRVSLSLAAVPAVIITVGSLILPETPNSLIQQGHRDRARNTLQMIRGIDDVDQEFQDLVEASEKSSRVGHPWKNILERRYRPQLVMAIAIPFLQQFTGINVIMFYAPVLFKTLGYGDHSSLLSAVITGTVNVVATLIYRYGRRFLFLQGGAQMFTCQIAVGILIGRFFGMDGIGSLPKLDAHVVLALICIYVAAFAWSWGPLGWLVPSEIFPLEIRSAGQSITVSVNMFFTFVIAQVFLTMLCHLKFGIFFFFAGWVLLMTVFIYFFLPETKNVPIEEMDLVWRQHWFWGKYIPHEGSNTRPQANNPETRNAV